MKKMFYEEKKSSRIILGVILSFIVGFLILVVGEFLMGLGFIGLFALGFPLIDSLELKLFSFTSIFLVTLFWAKVIEKSSYAALGLRKERALKDFFIGWLIGGALLTTCVIIMYLLEALNFTGFNLSINIVIRFLILMVLWSIQGSTEELLARGWMFSSISAKHSVYVGIIFSSLFFGLLHLGNDGLSIIPIIDLVLFGVMACLFMLKTNSLWMVCGIHAAWNCFQGNVFSFKVSGIDSGVAFIDVATKGNSLINGGAFGVEGSLVSVIVQVIVIGYLSYDLYQKGRLGVK